MDPNKACGADPHTVARGRSAVLPPTGQEPTPCNTPDFSGGSAAPATDNAPFSAPAPLPTSADDQQTHRHHGPPTALSQPAIRIPVPAHHNQDSIANAPANQPPSALSSPPYREFNPSLPTTIIHPPNLGDRVGSLLKTIFSPRPESTTRSKPAPTLPSRSRLQRQQPDSRCLRS